jgi:hypothetical protein
LIGYTAPTQAGAHTMTEQPPSSDEVADLMRDLNQNLDTMTEAERTQWLARKQALLARIEAQEPG